MNLITKIIRNKKAIDQAKFLLYDYYVKDLNWKIKNDNPSGIKIKQVGKKKKLIDDFDDFSVWFSITDGKDLVACARLCNEDPGGKLEVERYNEAKEKLFSVLSLKRELNLIELNREALLTNHPANKMARFLLLGEVFRYCLDKNYSILTTSNLEEWVTIYNSITFPRFDCFQFKYCDSDAEPVYVYLASENDLKRMLHLIEKILQNEEKNDQTLCVS